MSKQEITKEMTIASIFETFPAHGQKLAQVMTSAGLHCVGCNAATWETLEAGILGHGMPVSAVDDLVTKLNAVLAEEVNLDTITLTPRAAQKFKEIAKEDGKEGFGLRFGDQAGGCGGFEYLLDFEEKADEQDETFQSEGIQIFIKKHLIGRLLGSSIDYVDGLQGAGFKITNPNVKSSCACGTSQGYC